MTDPLRLLARVWGLPAWGAAVWLLVGALVLWLLVSSL